MSKEWMCPSCSHSLKPGGKDKGEGIKMCFKCGSSWYILLCSQKKVTKRWYERIINQWNKTYFTGIRALILYLDSCKHCKGL